MSITETTDVTEITGPAGLAEGDTPTIDLTERPQPATTRPTFTITDAAAACAVSRKTITRKLAELALHGAAKDDDGIWRIPVEALLAVGLHPGRSLPSAQPGPRSAVASPTSAPATAPTTGAEPAGDLVTVPRQRWDDLRIRLARAEAEATERALALADARLALRALTAGPTPAAGGPVPVAAGPTGDRGLPARPARSSEEPFVVDQPNPVLVTDANPTDSDPTPRAADRVLPDPSAQLAAARSHAAQNGGYVPATPATPRKRRWWQPKETPGGR